MSKLLHKVWGSLYSMWEHRNICLYQLNHGIHKDEKLAIDKAIRMEFMKGLNGLNDDISIFFNRNIDHKLAMSINAKQQWLSSVWLERDRLWEVQGLSE